ncbi:MAG: pseudouridine-5'-phosphate glycosidase [Christensenellales bacterium]
MDVSADLQELAHAPVAVVCAGAKMILDIGRTLEYLERWRSGARPEYRRFRRSTAVRRFQRGLQTKTADVAAVPRRSGMGLQGGMLIPARCRKEYRWT